MKEDIILLLKKIWKTHNEECWEMPEYVYDMMFKYDITPKDMD